MKKVGHTSEFPFDIYWWTLKNLKNQNFENMKKKKKKKIAADITILHMCTKSHNQMKYSFWDTELDGIFLSFWAIFCLFTPTLLTTQKTTILKKWKKYLEVSSFWTCATKNTIIWCMLTQTWSVTDIIFCHFMPFFALLPHYWPPKLKFAKNVKKNLEILSFYTCAP